MSLRAWSSFQYGSLGWSLGNFARSAGNGQSGLASLRATLGAYANAIYGYTAETHVIHGWCYKRSAAPADDRIFHLHQGGTQRVRVLAGTAGEIIVYTGSGAGTEVGRTASGIINANVETYIEIRCKHSATVGEIEVRVNGNPTPALSLTGLNTGTASDQVELAGGGSGTRDISAWYFVAVDATAPNDFLGHIRYAAGQASGNGNSSQLVGSDSDSTDNYLLVDDPPLTHDSDATYVQSGTVGEKDTYTMPNLPTPPLTIIAVCPLLIAKKTDAGTRSIVPVVRSGGADYDGDPAFLGLSYDTFKQAFLLDPNGDIAWTESAVNAMETGVKVAS